MLGDISVVDDIYIVCGYTDMRKQIDGLCSIVKNHLETVRLADVRSGDRAAKSDQTEKT